MPERVVREVAQSDLQAHEPLHDLVIERVTDPRRLGLRRRRSDGKRDEDQP